jgi:hypothetical protein
LRTVAGQHAYIRSRYDPRMHFNMPTVMVITTFCAALYLLLNKSDRMFPTLAVIASGVQLLMAFGIMSLTLAKFRIDVILPAILVVAGVVCWMKVSTKGTITAATLIILIASVELLGALRLLS